MVNNVNEPLLQAADQLKAAVKDLFDVYDLTLGLPDHPQALRMRGRLQTSSEKAFPEISESYTSGLASLACTPVPALSTTLRFRSIGSELSRQQTAPMSGPSL